MKNEWISVKDKMPKKNTEVLTITKDNWYRVITTGLSRSLLPSQVTHWMPLPKPPKTE